MNRWAGSTAATAARWTASRPPAATTSTSSTRPWSASGRWSRPTTSDARRTVERMQALHGEGHPRGQAPHELDQSQSGLRRGGPRSSSPRRSTTRPKNRFLADFRALPRAASWTGDCTTRWPQTAAEADLAGRARHLPRPGALGLQPGRSGQSPAGRFRPATGDAGPAQTAIVGGPAAKLALARHSAAAPRDPRLKLYVTWQLLRFRRDQGTFFSDADYVPLEVEGNSPPRLRVCPATPRDFHARVVRARCRPPPGRPVDSGRRAGAFGGHADGRVGLERHVRRLPGRRGVVLDEPLYRPNLRTQRVSAAAGHGPGRTFRWPCSPARPPDNPRS